MSSWSILRRRRAESPPAKRQSCPVEKQVPPAAADAAPILLEGRLSAWLARTHRVPALKLWVVCDGPERMRRIVEREGGDLSTHARLTKERERSEADPYRRYYGVDLGDLSFYDLVLYSTRRPPEALVAEVGGLYRKAGAGDPVT